MPPDHDVNGDCKWCYVLGYAVILAVSAAILSWAAGHYR